MKVSWFSAGVSSAVATKLSDPDLIIYNHIDDQHPDTLRFIADCEKWFKKEALKITSPYRNVENACRAASCITMRHFTPCTKFLKIRERQLWEIKNPGRHTYVWGLDRKEKGRIEGILEAMPEHDHEFPLSNLSKQDCHGFLQDAGIERPQMYKLGYPNNNCIGCVRADSMGYWNKIREDFPAVFNSRARLEKLIGHSIIKGVFLKDLKPGRGRCEPVMPECGIYCEIKKFEVKEKDNG